MQHLWRDVRYTPPQPRHRARPVGHDRADRRHRAGRHGGHASSSPGRCSSIRCPTRIPSAWSGSTPTTRPIDSASRSSTIGRSKPIIRRSAPSRPIRRAAGHGGRRRRRRARRGEGGDRVCTFRCSARSRTSAVSSMPSDDTRDDRIVVLTYAYWARRFGGDPSVLGRAMTIDGARATIVGVLQRTSGPLEHDVALFSAARWPTPTRKGPFFTTVLGRLRPGVSRDGGAHSASRHERAALSDLAVVVPGREGDVGAPGPEDPRGRRGRLDAGLRAGRRGVRAAHRLRQRGQPADRPQPASQPRAGDSRRARRDDEAGCCSTSSSKPACSRRLPRWSALGRRACSPCSWWRSTAPTTSRASTRCGSPRRRVAWLAGLAAASGIVIGHRAGVARHPAAGRSGAADRRTIRRPTDPTRVASSGRWSRRSSPSPRRCSSPARWSSASLDRLTRVPVGIDTTHLLTASVSLPRAGYPKDADREAFWKRAVERLAALPGVQSVALSDSRPPSESGQQNNFDLEDRPTPAGQNQPMCTWVGVSPGFFTSAGVTLERGRLLDERSLQEDAVVVDRAWAKRFFPGQEVVGRRFHNGGCTTCPWTTVVGVVSDVRWTGLDAAEPDGTVYFPLVDLPSAFFLVRTAGDPLALAPSLRQAVKELDPGLALAERRHGRRADRRGPGDAALPRRADRRVRVHGVGAVGRRHLRRDGLLRPAAHARDRHSAGDRRGSGAGAAHGRVPRPPARRRRRRRRRRRGVPGEPTDVDGAVRRRARRISARHRRRAGGAAGRGDHSPA